MKHSLFERRIKQGFVQKAFRIATSKLLIPLPGYRIPVGHVFLKEKAFPSLARNRNILLTEKRTPSIISPAWKEACFHFFRLTSSRNKMVGLAAT